MLPRSTEIQPCVASIRPSPFPPRPILFILPMFREARLLVNNWAKIPNTLACPTIVPNSCRDVKSAKFFFPSYVGTLALPCILTYSVALCRQQARLVQPMGFANDMSKCPCDFAMTCRKVPEPRFMPTTCNAMATDAHCEWHVDTNGTLSV